MRARFMVQDFRAAQPEPIIRAPHPARMLARTCSSNISVDITKTKRPRLNVSLSEYLSRSIGPAGSNNGG
jgi:hypothetical protein